MSLVYNAVDGYLKLVRLPVEMGVRLLPGNGSGPRAAAKLAVDRADAAVRETAGQLFGDAALQRDGARRRTAADERERAAELRESAEETKARAARTEQQRKAASRKAEAKAESAVEKRAKRQRLQQLDRAEDALAERDEALTAKDEAQRLLDAAARTKAERKRRTTNGAGSRS